MIAVCSGVGAGAWGSAGLAGCAAASPSAAGAAGTGISAAGATTGLGVGASASINFFRVHFAFALMNSTMRRMFSETGVVSDFNVIYPFIKLFAHGVLSKIPTHRENTFNIVPIDFVIRATCAIVTCRRNSITLPQENDKVYLESY